MASALYNKGREGFLDGSIDWDTDDIRVMLVLDTYIFDADDNDVADLIPATNDNGRTAALGTKTVADGVAGAAGTSLVATAALASDALVIYKYAAADADARLIAYIDVGTGLPFTPAAGQTVNIAWDVGANLIFKL
jgi:hypothetical protein